MHAVFLIHTCNSDLTEAIHTSKKMYAMLSYWHCDLDLLPRIATGFQVFTHLFHTDPSANAILKPNHLSSTTPGSITLHLRTDQIRAVCLATTHTQGQAIPWADSNNEIARMEPAPLSAPQGPCRAGIRQVQHQNHEDTSALSPNPFHSSSYLLRRHLHPSRPT